MAFVLNYTKNEYESKLIILEGYHKELGEALSRMEELKKGMFDFWDDPIAQAQGFLLSTEIRQVINAMDRTMDLILFYRSAVEKLDLSNSEILGSIQDALSIVEGLGV